MAGKRTLHMKLESWYLNLDAKGLKYVFNTYCITCHFHFVTYNTDYSKLLWTKDPQPHMAKQMIQAATRLLQLWLLYVSTVNPKQSLCNISHSWCFSDRASWIDYILITNLDALIIIYS